jgi:hypothetical protein
MILSTRIELCLPTGKCQASTMEISILQPEVESFPRRMAFSDWMLRMSQSNIYYSQIFSGWVEVKATLPTGKMELLTLELHPPTNLNSPAGKLNLSQEELHAPTGS